MERQTWRGVDTHSKGGEVSGVKEGAMAYMMAAWNDWVVQVASNVDDSQCVMG